MTETSFTLAVLDMAGTTVVDDGIVESAFALAAERSGIAAADPAAALDYVRATMGQSKIDVFTHLADGDTELAGAANAAFETAYRELAVERGVEGVPGAGDAIRRLRERGIDVALTTGFSPSTREVVLERLPWRGEVQLALSPVDAGRGRPAPDMVLTAVIRLAAPSVQQVVVAGDTVSDIAAGRRAGAGLVVGVRTGAHAAEELRAAGADAVIDSVAELPELLDVRG